MFGDDDLAAVLACLETGIEAGAERYRRLVSGVRGTLGAPDATEDLEWLATALREAQPGSRSALHGERKEDAALPVSWRRWTPVIQRARR